MTTTGYQREIRADRLLRHVSIAWRYVDKCSWPHKYRAVPELIAKLKKFGLTLTLELSSHDFTKLNSLYALGLLIHKCSLKELHPSLTPADRYHWKRKMLRRVWKLAIREGLARQ